MSSLLAALIAARAVAAVLALLVARRDPEHRVFAVWLLAVAIVDAVVMALQGRFALLRAPGAAALTGASLTIWRVAAALWLLWPAGVAALALWYFAKVRPWLIGLAWLLFAAAFFCCAHALETAALRRVYLLAELGALLVSFAAAYRIWRARRPLPHGADCAFVVVGIELAGLLFGGLRYGIFERWDLSRLFYVGMYLFLAVLHGGSLWTSRPGSR